MEHKRPQIIILIASALALIAVRKLTQPLERPKPPNVVLIVIDTLRRDHVGCYGYSRDTTPQLDRFAKESVRCDLMIAASSWTIPSLMTIFTGLPPSLHQANFSSTFGAGITTMAQSLSDSGYQTAGFASNPFAKSANGFALGFDAYTGYEQMVAEISKDGAAAPPPWAFRSSDIVTRLASQWLDERKERIDRKEPSANAPFFLFALYFDPHADYVPPPPYDTMFDPGYTGSAKGNIMSFPDQKLDEPGRKHVAALYDGEIRFTDEQVGALIARIDALGLKNDTIVIVTSDHGEELWDHGRTLHGHTLYDELLRVPFIARWPGHWTGGKVLPDQVSNVSILATVIDAAGGSIPRQCQAPSLNDFLAGNPLPPQTVFAETDYQGDVNLKCIRTPAQKIVVNIDKGTRKLFDLAADPGEHANLADKPPAWAAGLASTYDDWVKSNDDIRATMSPARAIDRDEQMLKDLGYSQ